jgi:hypothetical protein
MADNIGHKTTDEYKQSNNNNNNKQHRTGNLKDEQHEPTKNPRINPGAREG